MFDPDMNQYLAVLQLRLSHMTFKRKEWELMRYLKWLSHNGLYWRDASCEDIKKYLATMNVCISVRRQHTQVIRDFYRWMKVENNPAVSIEFKRDDSCRLPKVVGRSAVASLIRDLDVHDDLLGIRDRLMVEFAYGSALRRDELRRANIEDVDFEGQTIQITGKGKKVRIVPVTQTALDILRKYCAVRGVSRGALFVSYKGRRLSSQGVYIILKERAGIRPHLLRHACAGHMLESGASIRVIQEMLGHTDLKTTQIYTAVSKKTLAEVVQARHPRGCCMK